MKLSDIKIAYIGGGSRGWARGLMSDLALEDRISGSLFLYDIDFKSAIDNEEIGNSLYNRDDVVGKWKYKAVKEISEALIGADIVIISILPGTFEEMKVDVHMPEKYGIYQSVGDTVGAGGVIRSLRTIPMFVEFAKAIEKYSPNAWVINYTNPMTVCVRTLYKVFPKIKAFGCCHEVFGTQELLANIYNYFTKGNAKRDDIKINVFGINHFTWVDSAYYNNENLFSYYEEFINKNIDGIMEKNLNWMNKNFKSGQKVKFDLFKRYGIIAAAGDRHLAEFCPGKWYLSDSNTLKKWGFALTSVDYRIKDLQDKLEKTKKILEKKEDFILEKTGEEGVNQICALLGLHAYTTNVNLPNRGQISNLPYDAVVETNAYFSCNNINPLNSGKIPTEVSGLVLRHVINQETLVESGISGDYEQAFRAFVNDPNVCLTIEQARELFNNMLEGTKKYLPSYNKYISNINKVKMEKTE